jgi:hypothetical protein
VARGPGFRTAALSEPLAAHHVVALLPRPPHALDVTTPAPSSRPDRGVPRRPTGVGTGHLARRTGPPRGQPARH